MKAEIMRTAGRRNDSGTVLFADGSRGTARKAFYSVFTNGDSVGQIGNYRTQEAAKITVEMLETITDPSGLYDAIVRRPWDMTVTAALAKFIAKGN